MTGWLFCGESGSTSSDKSTCQVKERTILAKSPPSGQRQLAFIASRWSIINLTVLRGWKDTQTPKPVALLVGSSQSSEGDLACG